MLEEHPRLLIDCCQDDAFLNMATQRLSDSRDERWRPILAEAALLYIVAAKRLTEIVVEDSGPTKSPLERQVANLVRRGRKNSMFVVCLQRTLLSVPPGKFPAVDLIRLYLRPLAYYRRITGILYLHTRLQERLHYILHQPPIRRYLTLRSLWIPFLLTSLDVVVRKMAELRGETRAEQPPQP